MTHACVKYKGECNGCGYCKPDWLYECCECGDLIYEGETYYEHGKRVYCERCNEAHKETAGMDYRTNEQ